MKRFSASSAAQLMQCHGSANLELAIPGYVEPQRDEMAGAKGVGTRMHSSFAQITNWSLDQLNDLASLVGEYSKLHYRKRRAVVADTNSVETLEWLTDAGFSVLTSEELDQLTAWLKELDEHEQLPPKMLTYVAEALCYYNDIRNLGTRWRVEVHAEQSIDCGWLPSQPKTTPDVVLLRGLQQIDVLDWKTGAIPVNPRDNDQLLFYVASALYAYVPRRNWSTMRIFVHVVQPGNLVGAEVPYSELEAWMNRAIQTDRTIMQKDLTLRPGDHCTFCPANPHSRGDKAAPWCPPMYNMLYPDTTNDDEILDL